MGFWKTYRGFSCTAQSLMAASFAIGWCLLGLGFWGELHPPWFWPQWWHKLSYGMNIFASATGFLIGVPIALVIVDTIKSSAAQKAQIDSVNRISKAAWRDFSSAVEDLCNDTRLKTLYDYESYEDEDGVKKERDISPVAAIIEEHMAITSQIIACRNAIKFSPGDVANEIQKVKESVGPHVDNLKKNSKLVQKEFGYGLSSNIKESWTRMISLVPNSRCDRVRDRMRSSVTMPFRS